MSGCILRNSSRARVPLFLAPMMMTSGSRRRAVAAVLSSSTSVSAASSSTAASSSVRYSFALLSTRSSTSLTTRFSAETEYKKLSVDAKSSTTGRDFRNATTSRRRNRPTSEARRRSCAVDAMPDDDGGRRTKRRALPPSKWFGGVRVPSGSDASVSAATWPGAAATDRPANDRTRQRTTMTIVVGRRQIRIISLVQRSWYWYPVQGGVCTFLTAAAIAARQRLAVIAHDSSDGSIHADSSRPVSRYRTTSLSAKRRQPLKRLSIVSRRTADEPSSHWLAVDRAHYSRTARMCVCDSTRVDATTPDNSLSLSKRRV